MARRLQRKIDELVAQAHATMTHADATLDNANEEIDDTAAAARAEMKAVRIAVCDLLEEGVNVKGTFNGTPLELLGLRITPVETRKPTDAVS